MLKLFWIRDFPEVDFPSSGPLVGYYGSFFNALFEGRSESELESVPRLVRSGSYVPTIFFCSGLFVDVRVSKRLNKTAQYLFPLEIERLVDFPWPESLEDVAGFDPLVDNPDAFIHDRPDCPWLASNLEYHRYVDAPFLFDLYPDLKKKMPVQAFRDMRENPPRFLETLNNEVGEWVMKNTDRPIFRQGGYLVRDEVWQEISPHIDRRFFEVIGE